MSDPVEHILGPVELPPIGQRGPVDHQHAQAQRARGVQLGGCARSTGIFGDDQVDAMVPQQACVVRHRERAAIYDQGTASGASTKRSR